MNQKQVSPNTESDGTLALDFPGSTMIQSKFLSFSSQSFREILLQQPKWTRRGIHSQHARKFQKSISRKRIIQLKMNKEFKQMLPQIKTYQRQRGVWKDALCH